MGLFLRYGAAQWIHQNNTDPRCITNGYKIPAENYADQPYVIVCDDGSWLCVVTTSYGTEGAHMNHIISTKSYDQGKTWSKPVDVEPPAPPQSSWAVPLKVPGGRIYVFYNYNAPGLKGIEGVMSGPFLFKYSDDNGLSWSTKHYEAPIRKTRIDEENYTHGDTRFFWSIAKPIVTKQAAYITFSKILRSTPTQRDFYTRAEGFIIKSTNILTEKNPEKIRWETLPEGETGIWNPDLGQVQAEHNMVMLDNGSLYVAYRTQEGSPAYAISTDGGKTFSKPQFMRYANGQLMGNPRACPKIYKTKEGKYLFWFHNDFRSHTYLGRNPAWLSGGVEKDGNIVWSQPEIVLYDNDPELTGMSYPDFFEQDGRLWITETQKSIARVHEINMDLLQGLWNQASDSTWVRQGLVSDARADMLAPRRFTFPTLPDPAQGGGFSIGFWIKIDQWSPDQWILSDIGAKNIGIEVGLGDKHNLVLRLNDGRVRETTYGPGRIFFSDSASLTAGKLHHVVVTVDGAAKIVTMLIDGVLSDGSPDTRPYGWGRLYPYLQDLNDTYQARINPAFHGTIQHMRVYNRYLRTSEAIANFHAGIPAR